MNRVSSVPALTQRDAEILSTLACRVRCLSIGQIATQWWGGSTAASAAARRRLSVLVNGGFLKSASLLSRPVLTVSEPLVRWRVGEPDPHFGPIAQILKSRMLGPAKGTSLVVATAKTARQFGGTPGRFPRRSETTHDLSLAQVYLNLCRTAPRRAACWLSEAALVAQGEGRGQKLPDAMIVEPGNRCTVIEFGGQYEKKKLEAFHADCRRRDRSYEIW